MRVTKKSLEMCENRVLCKLITKAEKRKLSAENYHVYALLQSTIEMLQMNDKLIQSSNKRSRQRNPICKNRNNVECENRSDGKQSYEDVLQMDNFFSKLNSLESCIGCGT